MKVTSTVSLLNEKLKKYLFRILGAARRLDCELWLPSDVTSSAWSLAERPACIFFSKSFVSAILLSSLPGVPEVLLLETPSVDRECLFIEEVLISSFPSLLLPDMPRQKILLLIHFYKLKQIQYIICVPVTPKYTHEAQTHHNNTSLGQAKINLIETNKPSLSSK